MEEKGDVSSAKSEVALVMMDLSTDVSSRWERELFMETRVEETTPVSSVLMLALQRLSTERGWLASKQEAADAGRKREGDDNMLWARKGRLW